MKKTFGWLVAWTLFWMGNLVSKPMYYIEWMAWLYPLYNTLMTWSCEIQDWSGNDSPWGKPSSDE